MTNWYKEKADFHYKSWEVAVDAGKEKAANYHQREYLNYQEMVNQMEEKGN